ncbi:MAG: DNA mismatch repair endonuclease MutL [Thiotrichales bacterium]|nr:DNA mismatch repair endonuclease MutL [Thiotrichales bacterium]
MSASRAPAPIRALSAVLANQIAAGEVVERPASVVKELVENALDAEAKTITVELEAGGVRLIRVRDDGFGIPSGELVLALSRHATSKIAILDDLDHIRSMGFRGEALPSIASVSRLVLASRPRAADNGARVHVDGGTVSAVEPVAAQAGTVVEVRDLFFNVPARRKFLRTPRTELRHAEDAVRRLALARPDVSFTLRHDARRVVEATHRMEARRRLSRLVAEEFAAGALEIEFDAGDLSMRGFLGPPNVARARADLQFLFVNGRSVRDDVVRHAVRVGFGDALAGAQYPAFVLHLGIDPAAVDVNVHPTKHEVRFREPRHIHDFVRHAIARALGGFTAAASPETVPMALEAGSSVSDAGVHGMEARSPTPAGATGGAYPVGGIRPGEDRVREQLAAYSALSAGAPCVGSGAGRGQIRLGDHMFVENGAKLLLIDLRAARRALVKERLDPSTRMRPTSRPLLIPHTQAVPDIVADAVDESEASLRLLGMEVRRNAPGSITLRAIPACLAGVAPENLLDTISSWAKAPRPVAELADALAALAESSPFDGDADDIVDAARADRLDDAAATLDEAMLRRLFAGAVRR